MKLELPKVEVETSDNFITQAFSLGDSRVIMTILRSKLYSSPIRTVCQEIMSNARDAHREVKKSNLPIHVTLPNSMEPQLKVRDFGPGISPDRMANVFIKYGNSTKRGDNLQTGGFGLGAKSPFSYTDSFTIVTVIDKIRREYIAYIDESQLGAMSLVKEEASEELDGTSIIIPVKPNDFSSFSDAVCDVGTYWEPRPEVKGRTSFTWPRLEYVFKSPNNEWGIIANTAPKVIIDGIPYKLQTDILYPSKDRWSRYNGPEMKLLEYGLQLFVPGGKLKVTASREDLDYQTDVIAIIKDLIAKALVDVSKFVADKIKGSTNWREACLAFSKLQQTMSWLPAKSEWNGLPLIDHIDLDNHEHGRWAKVRSHTRSGSREYYNHNRAYINSQTMQFMDDTATVKSPHLKLATLFDQNPGIQTIQLIKYTPPVATGDPIKDVGHADAKKKYAAYLKWLETEFHWSKLGFINISTVANKKLPPRAKQAITKVRECTEGGYWTDVDVDLVKGKGYYVESWNGTPYASKTAKKNDVEFQPRSITSAFDFKANKVYSISTRYVDKLGDGWKPLHPELTKLCRGLLKDSEVKELAHEIRHLNDSRGMKAAKLLPLIKDPTGPAGVLMAYLSKVQAIEVKANKLLNLMRMLGLNKWLLKMENKPSKLLKYVKNYESRYILVGDYYSRRNEHDINELSLYINAKDESLKETKNP